MSGKISGEVSTMHDGKDGKYEFGNRRKPDKMQWLLVWLMGMIAAGIGYQIVENKDNAVTRTQVQTLIDHDGKSVQQWQIDSINTQLSEIKEEQRNMHRTIEKKIPQVTVYRPMLKGVKP